ncbi:MAG: hypothetical protein JWQ72_3338 [Polaromonas sp.]|nr:hypothetical protein [Polaromonas sp.]
MITVHHLDYSRSTRVLWLLEEAEIEYALVRYRRNAGGPAPAELSLIHPLGKSPAIVDGSLVLAESSAILRYIDRNYAGHRFSPAGPHDAARHDEWIDFVEGSAALPVLMLLMGGKELPGPLEKFARAELSKLFGHVSSTLAQNPYLMGHQLTLADIQMSYILAISGAAGLMEDHAVLDGYLGRLHARPALVRAIARGGPMTPVDRWSQHDPP